jgi:AcrR family transcriptional regulator
VAPGVLPKTVRRPYHHGDLRRALLDAGVHLAQAGGPEAVVLRAATRAAGVAPNAAYRHFADRDALLGAVSLHAQAQVAAAMEQELAQVAACEDPLDRARAALRAVGAGYLRFARAEPGLFRTAFSVNDDLRHAADPAGRGPGGRTPFELLGDALDELVDAGGLAPEHRRGADLLAWSAVHGLATLLLTGPLRGLDAATVDALDRRLLDMVERGLERGQA